MNTNLIEGLSNLQPTDLDAGQVFSGKPSGTTVRGYTVPSAYTPAIDHDYIFHECSRDVVVWFLNPQEPLYVFGPTGCGKTSCIKQLAARLNFPVFEVTGTGGWNLPTLLVT
jgi:cobaltochelatase CobS